MPAQDFFATTARNLESLLAEELRGLGIEGVIETRAGARFSGSLADAYRVCLWSRVANRVLLPLTDFEAADADALYAGVSAVDWSDHLNAQRTLAVHADSARSSVGHGKFAALKIKDAVVDQFRQRTGSRPNVSRDRPDIALYCHLFRDRATLSLDLSGESLHRRGYRAEGGSAPLKETLAAAILLRAGWPAIAADGGALLDPFCGSGTLPIEAAMIAADVAPGMLRGHWGFTGWLEHDTDAWDRLLAEAQARRQVGLVDLRDSAIQIRGSDRDPRAVRVVQDNLQRAGLTRHVGVDQCQIEDCRPLAHDRPGLLVANPPYGLRLGSNSDLTGLYALLGELLKQRFDGWQAAVFTGNPDLGKRMGLRAKRFHTLYNGPVECRLLHFEITDAAHVSDKPRPLPPTERGPGAEMLANRLRKNQKGLKKWLRAEDIACYRLYDADLPEYALAIDIYGAAEAHEPDRRFVNVQEYAAPASIDARDARRRLREAMGVIAEVLDLRHQDIFFKVRKQQKGTTQYERLADRGRFHQVSEDGLRLLVNFEDYLDTGLFLDHRDARRLIRRLAAGRRFLNLFGYTGSASLHAARGGARSTTTVDMSRTYIDWARRNLALNGYSGRDHELIQADCLDWLRKARAYRGHFGLILLDPPSFSASKRMLRSFDVQRDHVELIRAAMTLLANDGELIFSNNLRRFRLDSNALADLDIEDITASTIPRDFSRNPHIHKCWRLRPKSSA
ncbi:MAG: bifunctional 23S rRNA (guanine(2069)-N(7))-methyltransferase RlmK/23S rRNA (guanine(2445)-N(2))-methyltransferase RlmL [Thiohalocapsa sp.]